MNGANKINLLVITDLFPKFEGDVQGIFVLDYLASTRSYCNTTLLFPKVHGQKEGLSKETFLDTTILRYTATQKKPSALQKPFLYFKLLRGAYREIKKLPAVELVHAHGTIISGTIAFLLARKKKIPFIITEHVGPFTSVSRSFWKKIWTRFIMKRAEAVLCVSEHQKNEILSCGIRPKKMIVTYNPVDTELFKPDEKRNKNPNNILFAGRLDNFKGALRCAGGFKNIAAQYREWTFTIVGDGEDRIPLEELIESSPDLKKRIFLKGALSKKEIATEMNSASFFVFPSRHESFGLVIAEAMACCLPVIVGNQTAPKEFVDAKSGVLVNPDNITQIQTAMEGMTRSHSSYDAGAIRTKVVDSFGFENFGKKLADIYRSTLNKT